MRHLLLILALASMAFGQTTINGDRAITGAWDASGATASKPIPMGTSVPATCAVGEHYFKTDATAGKNIYACTATNTMTQMSGVRQQIKSLTLFDPVTTDSGRVQIAFDEAVTITRVACSVKAATSVTVNLDERVAATPDTAGVGVLTSDLACDTNEEASTTFTNASIAARVPVALTISAVSGTPDTLRVHISYVVN